MENVLTNSWDEILNPYFAKQDFSQFFDWIKSQYKEKEIYPKYENIFKAFELTDFNNIKVVILGQDPYHNKDQAQGLSFSVPSNITNPPSLKNIFKELENEFEKKCDAEAIFNGDLTTWAKQGVLLLNSVLTVVANSPGSHANKGWELLTDYVISQISLKQNNIVFLLWGNYAKNKTNLIDKSKHLVLESVHPSPFSARNGFFGCDHFKKCNNYLIDNSIEPIIW